MWRVDSFWGNVVMEIGRWPKGSRIADYTHTYRTAFRYPLIFYSNRLEEGGTFPHRRVPSTIEPGPESE